MSESRMVPQVPFAQTLFLWRLGVALAGVLTVPSLSGAADEFYENPGFNPHREYFNQAPNEYIDPFTGNLALSYTDIFLPGNGGLDLKIQRVYNSKIMENYGSGSASYVADSPAGLGWTITLGQVIHPTIGATGNVFLEGQHPVIVMPDGSSHLVYNVSGGTVGQTREFWKYEVISVTNGQHFKLTLTDCTVYLFKNDGTVPMDSVGGQVRLHVAEISDPDGNTISVNYATYANTGEVYPAVIW